MKWGIAVLLILGAVAAACAALLVGAMGAGSSASAAKSSPGVEVVVAAKSLPAMTVVTLEHFTKQAVPRNELPQGQQLTNPIRVVGRILAVPVIEGQVLTESCFVADGSGAQLAAALPEGMRAFTVNLSSRAIPDQFLLYPGCVVDVLVSFRLSSSPRSEGQAISTTMLRGIQVLVVSGESVVSTPEEEQASQRTRSTSTSRGLQVTLLVDSKQAEALQLAVDNGSSISLAIRNPLDKSQIHMEGTVLSQGRLADLGSLLTPAVLGPGEKQDALLQQQPIPDIPQQGQADNTSATDLPEPQPKPDEGYQTRQYPRWGVTVIRGRETKTEELAVSGNEGAAGANQEK
ncbi:MAG: Flp pilus assembly protein CpaB [Phycisphaerales bacterium]|nr:MAG: Flp pilus assembly protein CpaB [Phycisphaerales bacterium]